MGFLDPLYTVYEAQLERELRRAALPRHVAVITDGNRRYARARGDHPTAGHAAGAEKMHELLDWCDQIGIPYVTIWMLSPDNLERDDDEIGSLLRIIGDTVARMAQHEGATGRPRRITAVGALDLLPDEVRERLDDAVRRSADNDGLQVQVAVGYGGRREITDAMRALLREHAERGDTIDDVASQLTPDHLSQHLYATDVPDPDLIIRTSGEIRLSGFLMWQSAHSEFHFADPYWPAFRRVDFLRALRDYQARTRRFGR